MEFKNFQSYRCFKSVCLWSLILDLIVFLCFSIGYILTFIVSFIKTPHFAQGFGWIAMVFPTIFLKLISLLCLAVANGYLAYILFLEFWKKEQNLSLKIVDKTEVLSNKIIKNNIVGIIITILSMLSYAFNIFLSVINFYTIFIGLITFVILLIICKKNNKTESV